MIFHIKLLNLHRIVKILKMKKSIIWMLTVVMACTFAGSLYMQIMYLENMIKMRNEQFTEAVTRSLYDVSTQLEKDEAQFFLERDLDELESNLYTESSNTSKKRDFSYSIPSADGTASYVIQGNLKSIELKNNSNNIADFANNYKAVQESLRSQYLYQKGLINEVVLNILNQAGNRPIIERADSATVCNYLTQEFRNNGLELPFEFAITNRQSGIAYHTAGYIANSEYQEYSQPVFANTSGPSSYIKVIFPTKHKFIFSSVRFMIPSFAFTFILLVVFVYTIILAFRQKKLSEMKNDFINNMTHEFKTPISTISLAAQMLNDDSVRKSGAMLQHISTVINDETKRLRFQVEKVLQMSMFDKQKATLKIQDVDANALIGNIVNTHKIKVEKYGGTIEANLNAVDSIVNVDEMHFTNVIFNLLDNALKYRKEDEPLHLVVSTRNIGEESLEITVKDNGIGIKKEDLRKIFEKFYRVSTGNRHDVKGFGLGLAYVHKMINEFRGQIRAESEFNQGSNFIITLPLIK